MLQNLNFVHVATHRISIVLHNSTNYKLRVYISSCTLLKTSQYGVSCSFDLQAYFLFAWRQSVYQGSLPSEVIIISPLQAPPWSISMQHRLQPCFITFSLAAAMPSYIVAFRRSFTNTCINSFNFPRSCPIVVFKRFSSTTSWGSRFHSTGMVKEEISYPIG